MTLRSATTVRQAAAAAAAALVDAGAGPGIIEIRTGSPPASPQASATGTLLATLTCHDPFASTASGVITANTITDDSSADASGIAGWFRIKDSNGNAAWDGVITTIGGGGDIEFDDVNFVAGGVVGIDSLVITYPQ